MKPGFQKVAADRASQVADRKQTIGFQYYRRRSRIADRKRLQMIAKQSGQRKLSKEWSVGKLRVKLLESENYIRY